jgi:hypothetical protein
MSRTDLGRAVDCLYRGQLAAADGWCRRRLAAAPGDPVALNLLGCIAAMAGLPDHAARYFHNALPLAAARDNLELAGSGRADSGWPGRDRPGFVLIKAWGYGFCAELAHVLGGLLLARITGRVPVVQWGRRCLFSDGGADSFTRFFEPVSDHGLAALAALKGASLFPAGWSLETLGEDRPVARLGTGPETLTFLARPETILVCDHFIGVADLAPWLPPADPLHGRSLAACIKTLADAHLRPRPEILAAVAAFRARHLAGRPVVAVHVRGSDKVLELPGLDQANRRCFALVDALPADWRIFLLTDDAAIAQRFRRCYGDRLTMTESRRTADRIGIHYHRGEDGLALGRDVMTDVWLALGAERFIGNGRSNVSALIDALRCAAGQESTLVLENQLYENTCFL